MKVECICIDAKNRPKEVLPQNWISEGLKYHIVYTGYTVKTREIACTLEEVKAGHKDNLPIGFKIERFAFTEEGFKQLLALMKECTELGELDLTELLEEKELEIIKN